MATITATNKDSGTVLSSSTAVSASYTPSANKLQLATFGQFLSGTPPNTPTASGCSLTWVAVRTYLDPTHSNVQITIFRALGSSPTTGSVTFDCGGQTQTAAGWTIEEFANTDTSGTNGSGAIVQSGEATSGLGSSISVSLGAFGSADNATYGGCFYATGGSPTVTPGSGFTELAEATTGTLAVVESEFRGDNSTTVNWTCNRSDVGTGIGLEIKNASQSASASNGSLMAFMAF